MKIKLKKLITLETYEDLLVAFLKFFIKRNPVVLINKGFNQKHPYLSAGTSIIIIFLLLLSSLWWVFFRNTQPVAAWWDDTWGYRRAIQISNSNGADLTDFQVAVTIDTATLISEGKLQSQCQDLRFTDKNGNVLPYWIEENNPGCNNSATKVWLKIPTVYDGANATTIYTYYGKSSASDKQNGDEVFEFFDDFGDDELKQGWIQDSGIWSLENFDNKNTISIDPDTVGNNYFRYDNYETPNSFVLETRNYSIQDGDSQCHPGLIFNATNGYNDQIYLRPHSPSNIQYAYYDGSVSMSELFTTGNYNWNTWVSHSLKVNGDSVDIFQEDSYKSTRTGLQYDGIHSDIGLMSHSRGKNYFDFIFVREYASTDPTAGTPATEEKSKGPVGYWSFDEGQGTTANDGSSNGNDGTISGATWQTEDQCVAGKCLAFDGSDDYVSIGATQFGSTSGSVSVWFRPITGLANATMIFGHQNGNNRLYIGSDAWPRIKVGIADNGGIDTGQDIAYGEWQHIVLTYNSGAWVFYYNGKQVSNGSYSGSITFTSPEIGDDGGSGWSNNFKGNIDEVKVYQYARTTDEIKQDYNAGLAGMGTSHGASVAIGSDSPSWMSDGLVGHWKMDEASWNGTSGEVIDASGNGNNGTAVGEATTGAGKFGNGGSFDGTDDFINLGNDEIFDLEDEVSIGMWVKDGGDTQVNLLDAYNIDWTDPNAWSKSTTGTSLGWDETENALKAVSYYNMHLTQRKIPIDTTKGYHLTYDIKTKNNADKGCYSGTHSYETYDGGWLPGHPGSYDYFVDSNSKYTEDTWYSRNNNAISGNPRTGESDLTSDRAAWHTGTEYATIMFLANYTGTTNQETYIKDLSFYSNESEFGKANSYGLSFDSNSFSGVVNDQRLGYSMPTDQWNFIMMTYDKNQANNQQKIYLNGELVEQAELSETIDLNDNDFLMLFNGGVDEARVYNRALSPEEVKGLYEYAPGPVGHWKMDEGSGTTAVDSSGNGNNGAITAATWEKGKYGSSLNFSSTSNTNVRGTISPAIIASGDYTQEAWIYATANVDGAIIDDYNNAEHYIMRNSTGTIKVNYYDNPGTPTHVFAQSTKTVPLNTWTHVAGVVESGDSIKVYVNGELWAENNSLSIESKILNDFSVGQWGGGSNKFDGLIDDVRIYNYARTPKQIVEDMNAGHPVGGSPVGSQVSYWKFNEGFGSTAHDSVGDNDGTINSVTWTNDGKFGKALSFDGTDDDVEIKDGALITEDNYSITAFVKLNDLMSSDGVIFSNDNDSGDQIIDSLGIRNGQVAWNYVPAGTYKQGTTTILELNQWYHVVLTSNGGRDGEVKLYINGVEDAITSTGFYRSGSDVRFGARESSGIGTVFFNGFLDEVKIYNYALSENEIKKDYNQGKSLVMGSSGETSSGLTGQAAEYCVPGDTSTCNPPVAEWKFDDKSGTTVYDTSGNGNNGAMINMEDTDWQTSDQCKKGRCMNFNESDEKIALNSPFGKSGYTTVSLWYKRSENHSSGSWRTLVGHTSNIHHLIIHSTSRNLGIWDGGWKDFGYNPPDDGKWHHYEVIYNSGTSATLYVDGVYKNEISTVLNLETYPISTIGNWGGGTYWSGFIDNIKIYDYARTPAQIAWDHNRGKPIAHWKMDEGEGIIVHDESGNGNHGTMQNMSSDDWVDGRNNGALDFDGGDDWGTGGYIIINNPENFNVKEDNSFTLTGWFFIDFDQRGTIFSTGALGGGNGFGCKVFDDYGYLRCEINGSSGGRQDQRNYNLKNEWNFMSWSFDGVSNTSELFLNGKKDIKLFEETGDINYAGGVSVGSVNGNYYFFPGKLDDIQIYNYALTPLQVKNIYNGGAVNYR